jgi:putative ATPase
MAAEQGKTGGESRPLAWRMAPRTLDELVGQEHLLAPGCPLRAAIEADRLSSLILYGPPGTGKTALSRLIAERTKASFHHLNAVSSGVGELRKVLEGVEGLPFGTGRPILFIDELHRFNKSQQDVLLPAVEEGRVTLIGASTYNPFTAVIPALASRSIVAEFRALSREALGTIIDRAVADPRGLSGTVTLDPGAKGLLIDRCGGDARRLLNALELAAVTAGHRGETVIGTALAEEILLQAPLPYDIDEHYDVISAFIKSVRGSDPDASILWLTRMLDAGEDPRFVARRMVILASEDIGLADPVALMVACSAAQAVEQVGLPEAALNLAEAALYLASAPKSNSATVALNEARRYLKSGGDRSVPAPLRDPSYGGKVLHRGQGYDYPHDHPGNFVRQTYRPGSVVFYHPGSQGREPKIAERLRGLWPERYGPTVNHPQQDDGGTKP